MKRQKNLFETIGKIERGKLILYRSVKGTCERCGKKTVLSYTWQHNDEKNLICTECAAELSEEGRIAPEHDDYFQVKQAKEAEERAMRELKEEHEDVEMDDDETNNQTPQ